MTVHTIRLEDQELERPEAMPYRVARVKEARCEHEVRQGNLIRQCRSVPTMVVDGWWLCTIHGRLVKERAS